MSDFLKIHWPSRLLLTSRTAFAVRPGKTFSYIFFAAALLAANPVRADYPLIRQRYMADPCGIEYNGRLYIYGSNDSDNTGSSYTMHSIACISTDDLKNWTDHGVVLNVPTNVSWATYSWAPQVVARNGRFYLYFGNNAGGIGVASSRSPTGPFTDAKGSPLINSSTPGAPGTNQWYFDPGCFVDDDGQAYLTFGGNDANNARIIKLNSDMISVSGSAVPMPAPSFFEASYIHKYNNNYYFSFETLPSAGLNIQYGISANPMSGYAWKGAVLTAPSNNNNNQAAFFSYQGAWYAAYHNRYLSGGSVYQRNCCLDRVNYNPDGTLQTVACTLDGLAQLHHLNPYNQVEAETMASESGINTEACTEGGMDVGFIQNGSWIEVRGVDFGSGASSFIARVASAASGGNIEIRLDSATGTLVGTCPVSGTGGWQTWATKSCTVSGASGVHDLYLRFTGGSGYLFNLNWWQFQVANTVMIDPTKTYQTIEGLGGATAFYAGWVKDHPYKQEIYTNAFAGLNLSMLRLGDWYRYQTPLMGFDAAASDIVSNANRIMGHPVPVLISSWSPPAFLKSNGQVGNGGTLVMTNGGFGYTNFANYWYDSLMAYKSNGVTANWISIQNEPDWAAGYDSCIFHPKEDTVNGTNYASYSKALDAVYQRLTNLPSPPKIIGPEVVGLGYNDVQNYAATMNGNSFYGVTHHLYGGSTDGTPAGYIPALAALNSVFPDRPHFMTEYGLTNMIDSASLIHYVLTVEQASGYNYWSLVWPLDNGLVNIENPYDRSSWTNAPPGTPTQSHGWWLSPAYWSMKHFSYFITPGYKRVAVGSGNTNVLASAYLSPDNLRLVAVLVNGTNSSSTISVNPGAFSSGTSSVYQTAGTSYFQPMGPLGTQLALPAGSLTTIVFDESIAVGAATNPVPTNGETAISVSATLSWSPGSNALLHALYFGPNSNSVAIATPSSPEFQGIIPTNSSVPVALAGSTTYYWRVDEIAGINTNAGAVWSFSTAPIPALAHRYSFGETGGVSFADSIGGPAWSGALPNGGTLSGGQLTLASGSQQYGRLPAGIVGTFSNFTVEAWVNLSSNLTWNRIFDFGNNATVYMFLTPSNGNNGNVRFAITTTGAGGEQRIDGTAPLTTGAWHHLTVTLNGTTGVLYVDGLAVKTNTITLRPLSLGSTTNNYIGKSQYPDPYMNGALDEFRIYSVALSPAEIAATDALGPNQLLSTQSPPMGLTATATNLTLTWPLAAAGFTLQSCTNLFVGGWSNVPSPAPQIVNGQWQITLPISNGTDSTFYRLSGTSQ